MARTPIYSWLLQGDRGSPDSWSFYPAGSFYSTELKTKKICLCFFNPRRSSSHHQGETDTTCLREGPHGKILAHVLVSNNHIRRGRRLSHREWVFQLQVIMPNKFPAWEHLDALPWEGMRILTLHVFVNIWSLSRSEIQWLSSGIILWFQLVFSSCWLTWLGALWNIYWTSEYPDSSV